jgi:hypothetical protein
MRGRGGFSIADFQRLITVETLRQSVGDISELLEACSHPIDATFGGIDWEVAACAYGAGSTGLLIEPAAGNVTASKFVFLPFGGQYALLTQEGEQSSAYVELEELSTGKVLQLVEMARSAAPR